MEKSQTSQCSAHLHKGIPHSSRGKQTPIVWHSQNGKIMKTENRLVDAKKAEVLGAVDNRKWVALCILVKQFYILVVVVVA